MVSFFEKLKKGMGISELGEEETEKESSKNQVKNKGEDLAEKKELEPVLEEDEPELKENLVKEKKKISRKEPKIKSEKPAKKTKIKKTETEKKQEIKTETKGEEEVKIEDKFEAEKVFKEKIKELKEEKENMAKEEKAESLERSRKAKGLERSRKTEASPASPKEKPSAFYGASSISVKEEKNPVKERPESSSFLKSLTGNKKWFESEGELTVDVYQTDTDIVIQSAIAGVKGENLDITIENDLVIIRGTREKNIEVEEKNYFHQECYWGSFSRKIILPVEVDPSRAQASMKDGILTIKIPKIEREKKRKIMVKE